MIPFWVVATVSLLYFVLLFAVAYYADKKRAAGQSIISNPTIYSLSLAVYATSWTFYGSVGRAATIGLDFLPVYLGPTLICLLLVVSAAQDRPGQQRAQHRQHRRLHLQPLRQIGHPGGRRHRLRRHRHHALHRPAAEGGFPHLRHSLHPSGPGAGESHPAAAALCRYGLHRGPLPGALRRPFRGPSPGRHRAPRRPGGGHRPGSPGQARRPFSVWASS